MKRFLLLVVAIVGVGGVAACNKPTADDCRLAIANMQLLLRNENAARNSDNESEVRSCKGGSSKEAVACAIKATTRAELDACDFWKTKSKK